MRGGNQRFVDAIVAQLPPGTVSTNQPVSSVRDAGDFVEVRHGLDHRRSVVWCEQVVLTVPLWSLAELHLDAELEPAAVAAVGSASAGCYVKVLVRLRPEAAALWERHGENLFTLLSDSAAGCIYLGDGSEGTSPLLTQLVHGQYARRLCGLGSDQIARGAVQDLAGLRAPQPLWPGLDRLVTETRAYAYPRAVAYWPVHRGRSRYDAMAVALRRAQGRVHFAGDTLETSHSDGAVRSGQRVAQRLVALFSGPEAEPLAVDVTG